MMAGRCTVVIAPYACGNRMDLLPRSTRPSTDWSLVRTNAVGGSWSAFWPASTAEAASRSWHRSPAWIATPLLGACVSCTSTNRPTKAGCGDPVLAASGWRPPTRGRQGLGEIAGGYHGGRPGLRDEVDPPLAPHPPQGPPASGHQGGACDHCAAAASDEVLVADVPQAQSGHA